MTNEIENYNKILNIQKSIDRDKLFIIYTLMSNYFDDYKYKDKIIDDKKYICIFKDHEEELFINLELGKLISVSEIREGVDKRCLVNYLEQ